MTNRLAEEAAYFGAHADGEASRDEEIAGLKEVNAHNLRVYQAAAEVLRQQLAEVQNELGVIKPYAEECSKWIGTFDELRQQLADGQKQVTLLRDALTESRRELDSCQKVIWLASDYGFDLAYVKGAQASIRKTDEALATTEPKK